MKDLEKLNSTVFILYLFALNLEAIINTTAIFVKAPKFVELLHLCSRIESSIAAPPYLQKEMTHYAWAILAFQVRFDQGRRND